MSLKPLIAAVAVVVLAFPGAAAAKSAKRPPPEFFGTLSFEPLSTGEVAAIKQARIGSHRVFFGWPGVEPAPGERRWDYLDYQVGTAAQHGVQVFPVLYGTARHTATHVLQPPTRSPAAIAGWRSFVADAVRRYGPGGEFWALNRQLPYRPLTRWQVWNEPSSSQYWDGPPNPREYASLVRQTAVAIRSVDRAGQVVLAGILPHRGDPSGMPFKRFLRRFYRVKGIERFFDGVALHPYTTKPTRVVELAEQMRELIRREGDRKASLWITELGWSTGGAGDGRVVTSMEGQARRLSKTYRELLERRRALNLRGVFWHVLRDYHAPGFENWHLQMGLFTAAKAAKPAWRALTRITGGRAAAIVEPPGQRTPPPPPPEAEPCFLLIFC